VNRTNLIKKVETKPLENIANTSSSGFDPEALMKALVDFRKKEN
jgi:hypothetical protein